MYSIVVAWRFYAKWSGAVCARLRTIGAGPDLHAGGRSPERSAGRGGARWNARGGYAARIGRGSRRRCLGADSPAAGAFAGDGRSGAHQFADRHGDGQSGGESADRGQRQPRTRPRGTPGVPGYRSGGDGASGGEVGGGSAVGGGDSVLRSEEHTSELQS